MTMTRRELLRAAAGGGVLLALPVPVKPCSPPLTVLYPDHPQGRAFAARLAARDALHAVLARDGCEPRAVASLQALLQRCRGGHVLGLAGNDVAPVLLALARAAGAALPVHGSHATGPSVSRHVLYTVPASAGLGAALAASAPGLEVHERCAAAPAAPVSHSAPPGAAAAGRWEEVLADLYALLATDRWRPRPPASIGGAGTTARHAVRSHWESFVLRL